MNTAASAPCRLVVDKRKKSGTALSWGSAPFHREDKGKIIPNGFKFESIYIGTKIVGECKVVGQAANTTATFRFSANNVFGEFTSSMTSALDSLAEALKASGSVCFSKHRKGTNGSLHMGVRSPNAQAVICGLADAPEVNLIDDLDEVAALFPLPVDLDDDGDILEGSNNNNKRQHTWDDILDMTNEELEQLFEEFDWDL